MEITLDQAKAFCYVVDCKGYVRAAEKLHKSHSALIYLVESLEQQCGFPLFDRQQYRNKLSTAGERVYSKCNEILGKVNELKELCSQLNNNWEPSLKIILDGILPFNNFLQMHHLFRDKKIPTVIQTYTDYLEGVEETFDKLNADVMISILPMNRHDLKAIFLRPFNSYLVAHKDHQIHQRRTKWSPAELNAFDFLTIRHSGQKLGLNTNEFEKTASFFLSNFSVKKEAILTQAGFGWLPQHLIETELQKKTLIPVRWTRESIHKIQPILYINNSRSIGSAVDLIVKNLT